MSEFEKLRYFVLQSTAVEECWIGTSMVVARVAAPYCNRSHGVLRREDAERR
jgi:hypothetical protein